MAPLHLGIDRLLKAPEEFWELVSLPDLRSSQRGDGPSVGLVTSDASPPGIPGFGSARVGLIQGGVPLSVLFSPEHGLSGSASDGAYVADGVDPETGLPVKSLYGSTLAPAAEDLAGLDLVLFDLQDVGVRFYTYLWTLTHLMEACAEVGVPLRVLDRPNPLGGDPRQVEGPLLDAEASSFLGRWSIPIRHSLTLGEMALLLRAEMGVEVDLGVVAMGGWRRSMMWPETGLPYHPPSPGLPTFSSVLLYPGLALLEATNIHEGRGTEMAFQWFGAPWMEGETVASALNDAGIPGVRALPHSLTLDPGQRTTPGWATLDPGQGATPGWETLDPSLPCPGVRLEVTDASALRPVALGLRLLTLLPTLCPEDFRWTPYPTAANPSGEGHLRMLLGSEGLAEQIQDRPDTLGVAQLQGITRAPGWWERAEPHLLYL